MSTTKPASPPTMVPAILLTIDLPMVKGCSVRAQSFYSAAQVREAIAIEREACAQLALTTRATGNKFPVTTWEQLRLDIAAAIRGRGPKPARQAKKAITEAVKAVKP